MKRVIELSLRVAALALAAGRPRLGKRKIQDAVVLLAAPSGAEVWSLSEPVGRR